MNAACRPESGFTLVELLIVITIILVLAALSFMVVPRIRRSAQTQLRGDALRLYHFL